MYILICGATGFCISLLLLPRIRRFCIFRKMLKYGSWHTNTNIKIRSSYDREAERQLKELEALFLEEMLNHSGDKNLAEAAVKMKIKQCNQQKQVQAEQLWDQVERRRLIYEQKLRQEIEEWGDKAKEAQERSIWWQFWNC